MKPGRYLAGIAGARAVYLWMFEGARNRLPPPQDGKRYPIECRASMREIATALDVGRGIVRDALIQLEHYGWIDSRRTPRLLGHRNGSTYYLLADVAAEEVVGSKDVVSRMVLHIVEEPTTRREVQPDDRGTNREWDGTTGWTWGDQQG